MPSDPPIDPPNEAKAAPDPPAEAVVPPPVEPVEAAAPVEAAEPVEAAAPAPVVPAAPVSPVKEWAVAVAIMIVFAIICAQFITFLRSNPYGGPGP